MANSELTIIQISTEESGHAALYATIMDDHIAIPLIESTLKECEDYENPVDEAERRLREHGINRVYAIRVFSKIH